MIPKRKERAQGPLFLIPGSDGSELELHADVSVGVVVYTSNVGVDVDDAAGQNGAAAQVVVSADTDSARFDVAGAIHVNFVLTEEALHGQSVSLVSSRQTDGGVELSAGAGEHVFVFDEDAFHREVIEFGFTAERDFAHVVVLGIAQSGPPVAGVVFSGQRVGNVIRQSVRVGAAGDGVIAI